MSQVVVLKTFFTQLTAVLDNLSEMFPDDADFPTFKTFIGMLQKTNPTVVVNTFHESVVIPYEDKIDSRDEKFLETYEGVEYGSDIVDITLKLKAYWAVLDTQTKDSIWQYLYILKELSKRAYTKPA